ncbi:MAG TPA: hypothetical protein VED66_08755 [Candidatus Sulfotelmatobacter sp.]|nr:hypothetical protein [Candidatus Sulfotelmatobacter sp.]
MSSRIVKVDGGKVLEQDGMHLHGELAGLHQGIGGGEALRFFQ